LAFSARVHEVFPLRVEFYLVDAMEIDTFAPIYRALRARGVDARMVAADADVNTASAGWFDAQHARDRLDAQGLPYSTAPDYGSEAAVTTQRSVHLRGYEGRKVRLMYTIGPYDSENLQASRARGFDAILLQGPYAHPFVSRWLDPSRVVVTGFPKYDDYFAHPIDASAVKRQLGLNQDEPIVAYMPTWESRSSIDLFYDSIEALAGTEGICLLIKPHHCTPRFEPERFARLAQSINARLLPTSFPSADLFRISDLAIVDALSGTLGEALLTNPERPLICLCPDSDLLRSQATPLPKEICPMVTRPEDLPELARALLAGSGPDAAQVSARHTLRDQLFAHTDGTAAARTADAVIDLVTDGG